MAWYVRMVVVMITFFGASCGVLVVGPKFVRSNQEFTVVISNFEQATSKVDLMLRLEGQTGNGIGGFTIPKIVDVRRKMNRFVTFNIPAISSGTNIKLTIDGIHGLSLHLEESLVFLNKSLSGLIQIDKPVYKPGDTVKFRVIVLDTELKPPARVKAISVTIRDPNDIVMRKWSSVVLFAGVFENDLQLAPSAMFGMWSILAEVDGEELASKMFEVKEYVLSSFDVDVIPSTIPLMEHGSLHLTITANYHFGKPVKGLAKVELYLEDDRLDQKKELEMFGMGQVELRFNEELDPNQEHHQNVFVKTTFVEKYTVSKGTIQDAGIIHPHRKKKEHLKIVATEKMIPKAKILVATVSNNTVIWDSLDLDLKQLGNNLQLFTDETEVKPGSEINLQLKGRPGAYVALAAYDKGLLQFSSKHDLFWEDVMQLFDNFHAVNKNEFNVFHSMGLFVKLSGETKLEPMGAKTERFGSPFVPFSNLVHYRTNFLESWLWQNMTIRRDGMLKFSEVVPDTTTSWYLTAFSIDPVHGFGIIKKPIQFTTAQPFYIVENLPYSIKRDETAVLQFTLFNNLGAEYVAEVTLYNVANQTEFIGRPVEDLSYSKTVSVPSKAGAPVSFLVKARKLGEMTVRVKATIMAGREADAVEKVIRVMPENIIVSSSVPRVFNLAKYGSEEYKISLDILKQVNFRTIKLEFVLSPNLLTPVVHNLDNLLTVPTASGATSMINFIPNLVVLEYLHAVGSAETVLINKATALLRNGYQFEMQYRQPDGSFGNWRKSTGSIFVTALVGQSMQTASKYILEVDLTMVDQLFDWLASKQHSSGRFEEIAPITYHSLQDGSRNGIALTAFVMIALLENAAATQKHQDVVRRGIQHIVNHLPNITDVYDLSLATYALMLNGHSQKRTAIDLLIEKSQPVQGSDGKQRYWPRDTAAIETAAYGLLSLVHDKRYLDGISVMQWLVNQREATGSFPHTQDTFVGLKAISMLAAAVSPSKNDYTVSVQHGRTRKVYKMASMEVNRQFRDELTGESKTVTVGVHGRGFGLFEIKYRYGIDVRYVNKQFSLRLEPHFSNANHVLQLKVCTNFTPELTHSRSNLAQVEVNFPSGYIVDRDSMVDITRRNPVKNVEFHYGYTSMVVYYYSLGPEDNCFMVTAERLFRVAFQRPAYVLVHDSYHNPFRAIKAYEAPQDRCVDCH
ncbi:thioester-containing protein 1 allele S3-like [Anopheles moucheti]|uniref:thioester-containing protein 1 allele S3-like n=1 Tax=Anopheles moucheti TaxID=186751 RepID=UPI0022F0BA34|nr:thioester-containing protein 1 allele S3-like [Anopheles moucheti]